MGGGGSYYDRDVTATRKTSGTKGYSADAERMLSQNAIDPALLPKGWRLECVAKNPLVYSFDVTGSMGKLPKIIWDKWPGIVGQIVARNYLPDPEMSITAVGDIRSDDSPLQMCNFDSLRNLDRWLKRIHFEEGGGGQGSESYEMVAYYYLNYFDMPNAELPIFLMTGDEACVEKLYADDLRKHFGGNHENTTADAVFAALRKKFQGNVFRIHRPYSGHGHEGWTNATIVAQWERLLGKNNVIHLPDDRAIGDITLGLYAIVSGARTLDQYLEDMRTRPLNLAGDVSFEPQSEDRILQVAKALASFRGYEPLKRYTNAETDRRSSESTSARQPSAA